MTASSLIRKAQELVGSASANGVTLFTFDAELFDHVVMQVTGTFVATLTIEGSNDGVNWRILPTLTIDTPGGAIGTTINAIGLFAFNTFSRYVRARTTAYTSGTVVVACLAAHGTLPFSTENSVLAAGNPATTVGGVVMNSTNTTSGIQSAYRVATAAGDTMAALILTGPRRLYQVHGYNASANVRYFKVFNKATAPVPGTDTPFATIPLKALDKFTIDFQPIGITCPLGLGMAVTALSADLDNTVLAAGDILGLTVLYA